MDDFERTEAGNLTDEGIRQYLLAKFNHVTKIKDKRIEELEEKLEDWENSAKFVLGDDCPTDEVHCGCVVILKKRIKQLEALIKDVRNLINTKGHVSKWKIYNWLEQALKG